jgi:hypothetical protein
MSSIRYAALFVCLSASLVSAKEILHTFKKIQITDKFWAEGASYGDFNHDGKMDIVYGPFWYAGPDFKTAHEFYPANATFKRKKSDGSEETVTGFEGGLGLNNAYSDNFLTFTYDFNGDGWDDVLVYGFPGKEAFWYENPKGREGHWQRHVAITVADNESPGLADIDGDGKPELLCCSGGYIGYAAADWKHIDAPWKFHPVSPKGDYQRFTHGIGSGDVNGDGRIDILEKDGWWEQPESLANDVVWKKYPVAFARAAAQMYVYDVNGDGLNDVITSIDAHGYGLSWYEQQKTNGEITFREHVILNKGPQVNEFGISFTQLHSLALVDVDGDGLKDIVTGKRFWAHGHKGPDPESDNPAVLYWFKLNRLPGGNVEFIPNQIDDNSGVGTQVITGRIHSKNAPDILVGNKKGLFLFEHETRSVSKTEWEKAQPTKASK